MSLDLFKNRDLTLIIDKSGSMSERDTPGGLSRWKSAEEGTMALARKMDELDPDGISVLTFASSYNRYDGVTADKVKQIFTENEPNGGTVLAPVLEDCFKAFLKRKKDGTAKAGELLAVVTDGAPSDQDAVARSIIDFTKKLENDEDFGIQFIQIGRDRSATTFLQYLDDNLEKQGAKFDIVDTKTAEQAENMTILEVLAAGLTD